MGTSSAFGGQGNNTPLVPSWLEEEMPALPAAPASPIPEEGGQSESEMPTPIVPAIIPSFLPSVPLPNRFQVARTNLTLFAGSNGSSSESLGRSISHYVSKSNGGARRAARRMGSSRKSGKLLLGFLSNSVTQGSEEALRELQLEELAGLPIEDIFLGMVDYICPDGGSIDEGIARDAFIETIADLAENGISNLEALTSGQMETVFELYVMHTIVIRLYNDIGMKAIQIPSNPHTAVQIQIKIEDFIRRGVSDALLSKQDEIRALNKTSMQNFVDQVYEDAFVFLQKLSDMEEIKL